MNTISLKKLSALEFSVSKISSFKRIPEYKTAFEKNCPSSGFRYINKGSCIYNFNGKQEFLFAGDLFYCPKNSQFKLTIQSKNFEFTKINFEIKDISGNHIELAGEPFVYAKSVNENVQIGINKLTNSLTNNFDTIMNKFLICKIFYDLSKCENLLDGNKIYIAIEYIKSHYTENISVNFLSQLCFLSIAQMFRLFKKETGFSPIEYKNKLRIERAKQMLTGSDYKINEISDILGFENEYYFSRLFKKYCKCSPSLYVKNYN